MLQEVLSQAAQLMLQPVATAGRPLLLQKASEDVGQGELLFSPLPGQERSQESDAWQVC